MKKGLLYILTFALLLVGSAALPTAAKAAPASATDFEFDAKAGTITGYRGDGGDVEIPSTIGGVNVTGIGNGVFKSCGSLKSVTIPAGVTSIGERAFWGSSVTSVTIPASVTSIGRWAFYNCDELASVAIPEGVTNIGASAFYSCSGLTSVAIPASAKSVGAGAFANCPNLKSLDVTAGSAMFQSKDGVLLSKSGDALIAYPGRKGRMRYRIL